MQSKHTHQFSNHTAPPALDRRHTNPQLLRPRRRDWIVRFCLVSLLLPYLCPVATAADVAGGTAAGTGVAAKGGARDATTVTFVPLEIKPESQLNEEDLKQYRDTVKQLYDVETRVEVLNDKSRRFVRFVGTLSEISQAIEYFRLVNVFSASSLRPKVKESVDISKVEQVALLEDFLKRAVDTVTFEVLNKSVLAVAGPKEDVELARQIVELFREQAPTKTESPEQFVLIYPLQYLDATTAREALKQSGVKVAEADPGATITAQPVPSNSTKLQVFVPSLLTGNNNVLGGRSGETQTVSGGGVTSRTDGNAGVVNTNPPQAQLQSQSTTAAVKGNSDQANGGGQQSAISIPYVTQSGGGSSSTFAPDITPLNTFFFSEAELKALTRPYTFSRTLTFKETITKEDREGIQKLLESARLPVTDDKTFRVDRFGALVEGEPITQTASLLVDEKTYTPQKLNDKQTEQKEGVSIARRKPVRIYGKDKIESADIFVEGSPARIDGGVPLAVYVAKTITPTGTNIKEQKKKESEVDGPYYVTVSRAASGGGAGPRIAIWRPGFGLDGNNKLQGNEFFPVNIASLPPTPQQSGQIPIYSPMYVASVLVYVANVPEKSEKRELYVKIDSNYVPLLLKPANAQADKNVVNLYQNGTRILKSAQDGEFLKIDRVPLAVSELPEGTNPTPVTLAVRRNDTSNKKSNVSKPELTFGKGIVIRSRLQGTLALSSVDGSIQVSGPESVIRFFLKNLGDHRKLLKEESVDVPEEIISKEDGNNALPTDKQDTAILRKRDLLKTSIEERFNVTVEGLAQPDNKSRNKYKLYGAVEDVRDAVKYAASQGFAYKPDDAEGILYLQLTENDAKAKDYLDALEKKPLSLKVIRGGIFTYVIGPKSKLRDIEYLKDFKDAVVGFNDVSQQAGVSYLVLTGTTKNIDRALTTLSRVDLPPPQVAIDAYVVEIALTAAEQVGISWLDPISRQLSGFNIQEAIPANSFRFGTFSRTKLTDIQARVNALVDSGNAKVLAQPTITAVNQKPARIFIGDEIRFPYTSGFTQTGSPIISIAEQNVGITLEVTPHVNLADRRITLDLKPTVSSLIPNTTQRIGDFVLPQIRSREAQSVVRVDDGGVLAIGGLISDQEAQSVTKIPFLGDLPLIGELFRSRSRSRSRSELAILLRPRLLFPENKRESEEETRRQRQAFLETVDPDQASVSNIIAREKTSSKGDTQSPRVVEVTIFLDRDAGANDEVQLSLERTGAKPGELPIAAGVLRIPPGKRSATARFRYTPEPLEQKEKLSVRVVRGTYEKTEDVNLLSNNSGSNQ